MKLVGAEFKMTIWSDIPDFYTDLVEAVEEAKEWMGTFHVDLEDRVNLIVAKIIFEAKKAIESIKIRAAQLGAPTSLITKLNASVTTIDTWLQTKLDMTQSEVDKYYEKIASISELVEDLKLLVKSAFSRLL